MTNQSFGYTSVSPRTYIQHIQTHLARAFGGDSQVTVEMVIKALCGHNSNGVTVAHPTTGHTLVCANWDFTAFMKALVHLVSQRWVDGYVGHTLTDEVLIIHWDFGTAHDEVIDLVPYRFEDRDLRYLTK